MNHPHVAMVSGGSRGIGLAICRELLSAGWRVSVGSRTRTSEYDSYSCEKVRVYKFDAEDPQSEYEWVQNTVTDFGGVDALVHNAGVLSRSSIINAKDEEIHHVLNVNLISPIRLTRLVWPHLLAAQEGKVLVISSLAGKRIREADASLYALSKASVLALAHGIRHCGAQSRIRCTALCPGLVATDMVSHLSAEELRMVTKPQEVARIAMMVLELPASASIAEIPVSWTVEPQY